MTAQRLLLIAVGVLLSHVAEADELLMPGDTRATLEGKWVETEVHVDGKRSVVRDPWTLTFLDHWVILQHPRLASPTGPPKPETKGGPRRRTPSRDDLGGYPFLTRYEVNVALTPAHMRFYAVPGRSDKGLLTELTYRLDGDTLLLLHPKPEVPQPNSAFPMDFEVGGHRWIRMLKRAAPPGNQQGDDNNPSSRDKLLFQGRWSEIAAAVDGRWPLKGHGSVRLTVGDEWLISQQGGKNPQVASYTIDASKSPAHLDLKVFADTTAETVAIPCIFAVGMTQMTISQSALQTEPRERPTTFKTQEEDRVVKRIFARVSKPPVLPKAD